jgi:two-component system cell cycle response regulator CpdR
MARILLAEKDDILRRFLVTSLRRAGHAVDAVMEGPAVMAAIAPGPGSYDLLLVNLLMPGLDEVELARRVMSRAPHIRILFITGFAVVAVTRQYPRHPETRVLSKPFHLRELIGQIEKVLAA